MNLPIFAVQVGTPSKLDVPRGILKHRYYHYADVAGCASAGDRNRLAIGCGQVADSF